MKKKILKSNIAGLFLGLFCISVLAHATTVEKIVATVDGKPVTLFELDLAVKTIGPDIQKKTKATGISLRARVLDELINNQLLENAIDKANITVEQHEIDAFIDRILRSSQITIDVLEQKLKEEGVTLDGYKHQLYQQTLRNKFLSQEVGRKISITEYELKEHFDKNMDNFKSASSVRLAQITIPFNQELKSEDLDKIEQVALKIASDAQKTGNFEKLAKKYNGKPFKVHGGEVGIVNIKDLNPSIGGVASQLNIGKSSGPIATNSGIHIIRVVDRAKSSAKDFASVRDRVHDAVYSKKMEKAIEGYVKRLRKKAHIEIKGLGI